jgi:carboxyl-terminal processing protease
MRGPLAWCASLTLAAVLGFAVSAAPGPVPPQAGSPATADAVLQEEAKEYSRYLLDTISDIEMDYYRPVSRAAMVEAALAGLYETARQPFPIALQQTLQRLKEDSVRSDDELGLLVIRTREQLGHHEALRGVSALRASLRTLPRALDSYSGLAPPQDTRYLELPASGISCAGLEFVGVISPSAPRPLGAGGLILPSDKPAPAPQSAPAGPVRIRNVIPGSPAQQAGLHPDDLIIKLNGQPPEAPGFANLLRFLLPPQSSPPGKLPTNIQLTLLRPGRAGPWDVTLAPTPFRPETVFGARRRPDGSWDYLLDPTDRIGYIRLDAISQSDAYLPQTLLAFQDALKALRGQAVRGLVLDLRWSPFGYLWPAVAIARVLLPEGSPVAFQQSRGQPATPVRSDPHDPPFLDFPVVVLVGSETSGAAELIAAALQDNGRAVIAGQRTVGKGTIQTHVLTLEREFGLSFKYTSGTLVRPSGKNLQRTAESKPTDDWGVRPDAGRELPLTAEANRQLREWRMLFELRPADSTEALPLDDPENDPQRQSTVQMLRELIKKQSARPLSAAGAEGKAAGRR